MFLICRDDTVSPAKRETLVAHLKKISVFDSPKTDSTVKHIYVFLGLIVQTHLLVMPPPGGSPGISSSARNLIT